MDQVIGSLDDEMVGEDGSTLTKLTIGWVFFFSIFRTLVFSFLFYSLNVFYFMVIILFIFFSSPVVQGKDSRVEAPYSPVAGPSGEGSHL
jgi:hypothetical protein